MFDKTLVKNLDQNQNTISSNKIMISWPKAVFMILIHILAIYGIIVYITGNISWKTLLYFYGIGIFGSMGIQCGAHRLWSHRCFKANTPLKVLLMIMQTVAFQGDIIDWCRDHRVHHKFSDTDADPYNSSRGFFFSHMGWVFVKKHRDVKEKGKSIDISDLLSDSVVAFQHKYYFQLVLLFWGIIPIFSSVFMFGESFQTAFYANMIRYVISLHLTWTVNSVAHLYGMRPYDKRINPRNSILVIYWSMGEGYHNYHHVFPYDYSASEFGWQSNWNPATALIDLFARIGWATKLKVAPRESIRKKLQTSGNEFEQQTQFNAINYCLDFCFGVFSVFFTFIILTALKVLYVLCF